MKAEDVQLGQHYLARVSGKLVTVRVDDIFERVAKKHVTGWRGECIVRFVPCYRVTNTATGHKLVFRSVAKFRGPVEAPHQGQVRR